MKYIVGTVCVIIMLGFIACGNEGGESAVVARKKTSYLDFKMYKGSQEKGADEVSLYTNTSMNQDSLFRSITLFKYLSKFATAIEKENAITFEFLDNGILSFTDLSSKRKIISSYLYVGDSLFVLKNGTDKYFVAVRDDNGFHRTKSVMRKMLYNNPDQPVDDTTSVKNKLIDLDTALAIAHFDDSNSMTNPRDTIVWCNIKYIYQ